MAVLITSASGSSRHNGTLTVTGSGFGSKSQAAPIVWDNCNQPVNDPAQIISAGWTGAWPNKASNSAWNMQYRNAPYNAVSAPHARVNKFMVGSAGDDPPSRDAMQGLNTMVWKSRPTPSSFPQYTYFSWWQQYDPNWVFGNGNPPDDNLKLYAYGAGTSPYDTLYWYVSYQNGPPNTTYRDCIGTNDDGNLGDTCFINPGSCLTNYVNPFGRWSKIEIYVKISNLDHANPDTGTLLVVENGADIYNFQGGQHSIGRTDGKTVAGWDPNRTDSAGGFQRGYGRNNNRFFADLYLDYTWQHVVLGDASRIDLCSKLEVQNPTAWSDTSITVTVNRGVFSDSQKVYLYVYDATGTPNTNGLLVAGGDTTPPAPPKNLRIQ